MRGILKKRLGGRCWKEYGRLSFAIMALRNIVDITYAFV
jgi:hypothetical protein